MVSRNDKYFLHQLETRVFFLDCLTKGWFVCACSYLSYTCNTLPLHIAHSEFSTFALMRIYWWFSPRRTLANTEERCLDYSSWQSYLSSKIHLKQHLTMTALKFLVDIRNNHSSFPPSKLKYLHVVRKRTVERSFILEYCNFSKSAMEKQICLAIFH